MIPRLRTRRRPTLLLLGTVLLALLAGGCVRVPTSGPVEYQSPTASAPQRGGVAVFPAGPVGNATPRQIVEGFLDAMASYQPGYPVAREFLTAEAAGQWATGRVQVFDSIGATSLRVRGPSVSMTARRTDAITADGQWRSFGTGSEITVDFPLRRVDGQWRIARPPDGVLMSRFDTSREFDAFHLYFFDTGFRWFVPERRFLPARSSVESVLVSRLIAGPSAWLAPVVRTGIPEGATGAPTVTVVGETAMVNFDDLRMNALTDDQRRYLYAQLSETLGQVGIVAVSIRVRQVPLTISGLPEEAIPVAQWSRFDPTTDTVDGVAFAFTKGRLTQLPSAGLGASLVDQLGRPPGLSCAVSRSIDRLAIVSPDGRSVRVADGVSGKPRVVLTGAGVPQPSFDGYDDLWMVSRAPTGSTAFAYRGNRLLPVNLDGLANRQILGLRVSDDGVRAAMAVSRGSGTDVVIARVARSGAGVGPSIAAPITLPTSLTRIAGIAWSDPDTVAVLGARGSAPLQPYLVTIDGSSTATVGQSPSARNLAAADGQPLLLGSTDGTIVGHEQGSSWLRITDGTAPCYPG